MSSRHIYFFEDVADIQSLRYIERKYNSIQSGPAVIRRLPGSALPHGMEGFSAYTIDDRHINSGVGRAV